MRVQDVYAVAVMEMQGMVDLLERSYQTTEISSETRIELADKYKSLQHRLNCFIKKNAGRVGVAVESEIVEMDDNYGNFASVVNKQYADPYPAFIGEPRPFTSLRLDCGTEQYTIVAEVGGLSIKSACKDVLRVGKKNEPTPDGVFVTTLELVEDTQASE